MKKALIAVAVASLAACSTTPQVADRQPLPELEGPSAATAIKHVRRMSFGPDALAGGQATENKQGNAGPEHHRACGAVVVTECAQRKKGKDRPR